MSEAVRIVKDQIKALRAEMRQQGIRRVSFMNGGLDERTYRANVEIFRLETELKRLTREP